MVVAALAIDDDVFHTEKHEIKTAGCGTIHLLLDVGEAGDLQRVRMVFGKTGTCCNVIGEVVGGLITVGLQNGVPLQELLDTALSSEDHGGLHCHKEAMSCLSQLAAFLKELSDGEA